jgi:hypothetical protein
MGCNGISHTFETYSVAFQGLHSFSEEGFTLRGHAGNIVLLPLNGCIDVLENLLHRVCNFSTDAISGDQGDGIYSSVFRW